MIYCNEVEQLHVNETAVALGKFDGFHLGHRQLLSYVKNRQEHGLTGVIFTFADMGSYGASKMIDDPTERQRKAESLGIDVMLECPFTETLASMEAEDFVREILLNQLRMCSLTVGEDFRFGKDRKGDVALLQKLAEKEGFDLQVFEKVALGGNVISSSAIRTAIEDGRMEEAEAMLGMPYTIAGRVMHGEHVGHTIGFPTANLPIDSHKVLPPFGVYETRVRVGDRIYRGLSNLGQKPTVGNFPVGLETHLIDFVGDLYGSEISVGLRRYLRAEETFANMEELQAQMLLDLKQVQ